MLSLIGVDKQYTAGDLRVEALKDVSLHFRDSEFVSVLGPSGCGKTTLLNLIGGLDRYTRGDIVIRGKSTRQFRDADWDAYRNHTVGFVFQTYNLIPHQSVLSNVELALTLTGVSREARRKRAVDALTRVGLGDQLRKKPNQMSGGQMQRVAIARALVNNPDILLADEPTGALDSETSLQVMELLKEIAKDRLVIMVTHNPDLADAYSTRIIRLLDGRVVDDTAPYQPQSALEAPADGAKKPGMSFFTALSLSFHNLLTKKTRTSLVAFAGSIGIIGIALILSMSNGVQNYIHRVEEETLSSYPITITGESADTSSLLESLAGTAKDAHVEREEGYIYSGEVMAELFSTMLSEVEDNDLQSFKARIDADPAFQALVSGVTYKYDADLQIWSLPDGGAPLQVNPSAVFESMTGASFSGEMSQYMSTVSNMSALFGGRGMNVWTELMNNQALLDQQYDVIAGRWPQEMAEVVLVVNENNTIGDFTLYTLGVKPQSELNDMFKKVIAGESFSLSKEAYAYEELLSLSFQLVLPADYYEYDEATHAWTDIRADEAKLKAALENGLTLRVVGIVRPSEESIVSGMNGGSIGYLPALTEYAVEGAGESAIVKAQMEHPEFDIFTQLPFAGAEITIDDIDLSMLTDEQRAMMSNFSEDVINQMIKRTLGAASSASTYEDNLRALGVSQIDRPDDIIIYPKDFEAKEAIEAYINAYNAEMQAAGREGSTIRYTDYIGILLASVTTIIDAITYVLVAFVAVSLVVSSIMIGVITYISVLERTKEIGILRAMGASKKDISRVFNAETLIIGLLAGGMGIFISWLCVFPINAIIQGLTNIGGLAALPGGGAGILIVISVLLTMFAGLIPSRIAAKRDPVEALRSE